MTPLNEKGYGVVFAVLIIALLVLTGLTLLAIEKRREANRSVYSQQVLANEDAACNPGSDNCQGPTKLQGRPRSAIIVPIVTQASRQVLSGPVLNEKGQVRPPYILFFLAAVAGVLGAMFLIIGISRSH